MASLEGDLQGLVVLRGRFFALFRAALCKTIIVKSIARLVSSVMLWQGRPEGSFSRWGLSVVVQCSK